MEWDWGSFWSIAAPITVALIGVCGTLIAVLANFKSNVGGVLREVQGVGTTLGTAHETINGINTSVAVVGATAKTTGTNVAHIRTAIDQRIAKLDQIDDIAADVKMRAGVSSRLPPGVPDGDGLQASIWRLYEKIDQLQKDLKQAQAMNEGLQRQLDAIEVRQERSITPQSSVSQYDPPTRDTGFSLGG